MQIKVARLSERAIEAEASAILERYTKECEPILKPPVPVDDMPEMILKVRLEFDDRDDPIVEVAARDGVTTYLNKRGSNFEITTYDSLDPSLNYPRLNAMTTVKNWASYLALQAMFNQIGDGASAATCSNMAALSAKSIVNAWNSYQATLGYIPAFLDGSNTSALLPVAEGLAYPALMGMTNAVDCVNGPFAPMLQALSNHIVAVLKSG